jgi:hypothetical protein
MGLLIDETGDFDVEIVEDKLFLYSRGGFDPSSAALWQRINRIREVVGAKALSQTDRYLDAKPATEGGRRLRLGFFGSRSKVGIVLVIALVGGLAIGIGTLLVTLFLLGSP